MPRPAEVPDQASVTGEAQRDSAAANIRIHAAAPALLVASSSSWSSSFYPSAIRKRPRTWSLLPRGQTRVRPSSVRRSRRTTPWRSKHSDWEFGESWQPGRFPPQEFLVNTGGGHLPGTVPLTQPSPWSGGFPSARSWVWSVCNCAAVSPRRAAKSNNRNRKENNNEGGGKHERSWRGVTVEENRSSYGSVNCDLKEFCPWIYLFCSDLSQHTHQCQ